MGLAHRPLFLHLLHSLDYRLTELHRVDQGGARHMGSEILRHYVVVDGSGYALEQ